MIAIKQHIYFFFDDSGVLHKNEPSKYFVYAGYVFINREELEIAKRKYINANKKIKKALGRTDELKAANLEITYKRALFNSIRDYDTVAVCVDIQKVHEHILNDKKSICRYKDYILKRCVKARIERMINDGVVEKDKDTTINVYIDEQLTATNGYYDLKSSIKEELQYGVRNFDYGNKHKNVFDANVDVNIYYCDSSKNYMIQASDILANRIWTSFRTNNRRLRDIEKILLLTFP